MCCLKTAIIMKGFPFFVCSAGLSLFIITAFVVLNLSILINQLKNVSFDRLNVDARAV